MFRITNLLEYPRQKQTIPLPNGDTFTLSLYYIPRQSGWFIDELTYGDFTLNGVRLVNSPNILRQFKNKLPFGLAVLSKSNREPYLIQDLASEHTKIYVITESEVDEVEEFLRG